MDLQAVRFPVILHNELECTFRVHTKNSSKDQIDTIQIATAIKGRSLKEGIEFAIDEF